MNGLERIAPRILRVPPEGEPLSSDAFIIEGDTHYYVYDVGASEAAYAAISALDKPVIVILSHFHQDHTANMARLTPAETLVGARTRRKLSLGTRVDQPQIIQDGVTIEVRNCVSPHCPGCLIAKVDGAYTLIGDLYYGRRDRCLGEQRDMLKVLERWNTEYFIVSHAETPVYERQEMLDEIRQYFGI